MGISRSDAIESNTTICVVSPVGTVFPVIGHRIIILGMKALRYANVSVSANMSG